MRFGNDKANRVARVKAISSSGTPGGDGIANSIVVEPLATEIYRQQEH